MTVPKGYIVNIDSFTDEQLLNLVNSTITEETEFSIDDFTGGSIQVTTAHKNKVTNYKVHLFFGYNKSNNPVSYTEEIEQGSYFIWSKAIMLKVESMKVSNLGSSFNKMNQRMNPPKEKRNKKEKEVEVIGKEVVGIGRDSNNDSTKLVLTSNDEVIIAEYLLEKIRLQKPTFKRPNISSWAKDIEKAMRIDGRSRQQLIGCIDWIYGTKAGEFWVPNILSGKKLRDKFDTMEMQMLRDKKQDSKPVDKLYDSGLTAKQMIKEMEKRA